MIKRMVATGNEHEVRYYRRGDAVIAWRWDNVRKRYCPSSWPIADWPGVAELADKQAAAQQEAQSCSKKQ
jgi:hypothetical protein